MITEELATRDRLFVTTIARSLTRQRTIICDGIRDMGLTTSRRMQDILIQKFIEQYEESDQRFFMAYLESYLRNHNRMCQENVDSIRSTLLESHNSLLATILLSDTDFRMALREPETGLEPRDQALAISTRNTERFEFARRALRQNERIGRNILDREHQSNERVLEILSSQRLTFS